MISLGLVVRLGIIFGGFLAYIDFKTNFIRDFKSRFKETKRIYFCFPIRFMKDRLIKKSKRGVKNG